MKNFFDKLFEYFKKVDAKNIAERAFWTFVEGFLLSIPIISPDNFSDFINGSWKMVLAGAIGAGISAVKTLIIDIARQHTAKAVEEKEKDIINDADEIEKLIESEKENDEGEK